MQVFFRHGADGKTPFVHWRIQPSQPLAQRLIQLVDGYAAVDQLRFAHRSIRQLRFAHRSVGQLFAPYRLFRQLARSHGTICYPILDDRRVRLRDRLYYRCMQVFFRHGADCQMVLLHRAVRQLLGADCAVGDFLADHCTIRQLLRSYRFLRQLRSCHGAIRDTIFDDRRVRLCNCFYYRCMQVFLRHGADCQMVLLHRAVRQLLGADCPVGDFLADYGSFRQLLCSYRFLCQL